MRRNPPPPWSGPPPAGSGGGPGQAGNAPLTANGDLALDRSIDLDVYVRVAGVFLQ